MTEEQLKFIDNFEFQVHQLFRLCDKLKEKNANLQSQLAAQKDVNESLAKENSQLKMKYDYLKIARMVSVNRDDFKATKNRLSKLVRDVDKCIALLNE